MTRIRIEAAIAAVFAVLAVVTAFWPTWIESLTGLEPDGGSGESEWGIVVGLGVVALAAAAFALRHHRAVRAVRAEA